MHSIFEKDCQNDCRDPGSNQGPSDLQSDALPTELSRHMETLFLFDWNNTYMLHPLGLFIKSEIISMWRHGLVG